MKTTEAVTSAGGIWFTFGLLLILYITIGTIAIMILRRMSRRWREGGSDDEEQTPYSPPPVKVSA